mmetsp:Transcript_102416/g.285402  ORF Transcript_102416/g.285402 Transcript_102416/m.285402 type:complete len:273 (-) Transcript_102416:28-846(-)
MRVDPAISMTLVIFQPSFRAITFNEGLKHSVMPNTVRLSKCSQSRLKSGPARSSHLYTAPGSSAAYPLAPHIPFLKPRRYNDCLFRDGLFLYPCRYMSRAFSIFGSCCTDWSQVPLRKSQFDWFALKNPSLVLSQKNSLKVRSTGSRRSVTTSPRHVPLSVACDQSMCWPPQHLCLVPSQKRDITMSNVVPPFFWIRMKRTPWAFSSLCCHCCEARCKPLASWRMTRQQSGTAHECIDGFRRADAMARTCGLVEPLRSRRGWPRSRAAQVRR